MEIWKEIIAYEDTHEVSNFGNVKSKKRNGTKNEDIILKQKIAKNGYCQVQLQKNGIRKWFLVHRLVLLSFQPIDKMMEVDHINCIKTDNCIENLRWVTREQQVRRQKKRPNCLSQYVGVCLNKPNNKWYAMCRLNGIKKYLGLFNNEKDAAMAYNNFIIEHNLQEFASLNVLL